MCFFFFQKKESQFCEESFRSAFSFQGNFLLFGSVPRVLTRSDEQNLAEKKSSRRGKGSFFTNDSVGNGGDKTAEGANGKVETRKLRNNKNNAGAV